MLQFNKQTNESKTPGERKITSTPSCFKASLSLGTVRWEKSIVPTLMFSGRKKYPQNKALVAYPESFTCDIDWLTENTEQPCDPWDMWSESDDLKPTTARSTGPPLQLVGHFWIVKFDIECNSTILFDFWFISFFPRTCIIFILGSKPPPLGVCITSLTVQWSKSAILGNLRIVITRVIKDYAYDYHTKKSFPKDTIT